MTAVHRNNSLTGIHWILLLCFTAQYPVLAFAQAPAKPAGWEAAWGDQRNGTYINPVVPADFSDIDTIHVGPDFYAISSTFQFSPGLVILHSRDLVNWEILGHAVDDLTQIAPEMNWDRMDRYGRGIWAGALRFHDGRFWIYFGTPDEGIFMTSAISPAGPWAKLSPVLPEKGWDDPCPFWDDDGQEYLVCTHFSDHYKIHLFKVSADGKVLDRDHPRVIHQSRGSEANKLYKINGLYYHYFSEVKPEGRVAMMERSASLDEPWEIQQLNHVDKRIDKEPNQGGLIEVGSGKWSFLSHQGTGDWEGRAMVLLPVEWIKNWPIIGKPGDDGLGNMIWKTTMPVLGAPPLHYQTSDEFDESSLMPQWEWNYQPRKDMWSLSERPGFLRLRAFKSLARGDLLKAGNTLTQRALRASHNEITVKLDLKEMADGENCGICHFSKRYSMLGVVQKSGKRSLICDENGKSLDAAALNGFDVWLRSTWGIDGMSRYSYSLDGKTFLPAGAPYSLAWGYYRGDRIGLYNFNDDQNAGFVDLDYVHYIYADGILNPVIHK